MANSMKKVLLAVTESVYGQEMVPTAANAILVRGFTINPIEPDTDDRANVRPFFGNQEQLVGACWRSMDFEIEAAGSGTPGVVPGWGMMHRGCGLAETILPTAHVGTATAGAVGSISLAAAASAVDDVYRGLTLRITGGAGAGQARVIGTYTGATKIAVPTEAFTVAPNATSTYSIDAQVVYNPITDAHQSITIYGYIDGLLHKMTGSRGSVSFKAEVGKIPVWSYKFQGLFSPVIDATTPTPVLAAFQRPLLVNSGITSDVRLHGLAANTLKSFDVDLANSLTRRTYVGSRYVGITGRAPSGNASIEMPDVAARDMIGITQAVSLGAFSMTHGTTAGNIIKIDMPSVQLTGAKYAEEDNVLMLQTALRPMPVRGNDELTICVR